MDRVSSSAEAFEQHAEEYDKWFNSPQSTVLFRIEVEAVRLLMKDLEKPFLEIGVGSGRFARELGIEYGIDPSETLLAMARERGIKAEKAYGEKLPFADKIFGGVFILFTLCFVEEPERVLSEAKRVLNKGGGLIIGFINRDSSWGQLYLKKKAEGHPIYKLARFYSISEVKRMLEKTGMSIESYSSTLSQPPSEKPHKEVVCRGIAEGAGFICLLARKLLRNS